MSDPLRIFVSHSHQDDTFARDLVVALRGAGADVWYDEHNLGSGRLGPTVERAAVLDPNNAHTWVRIGSALSRMNRSEDALAAYERAITLDPTFVFAWYGKGFMLYRLGRASEAAAAHERARAWRA